MFPDDTSALSSLSSQGSGGGELPHQAYCCDEAAAGANNTEDQQMQHSADFPPHDGAPTSLRDQHENLENESDEPETKEELNLFQILQRELMARKAPAESNQQQQQESSGNKLSKKAIHPAKQRGNTPPQVRSEPKPKRKLSPFRPSFAQENKKHRQLNHSRPMAARQPSYRAKRSPATSPKRATQLERHNKRKTTNQRATTTTVKSISTVNNSIVGTRPTHWRGGRNPASQAPVTTKSAMQKRLAQAVFQQHHFKEERKATTKKLRVDVTASFAPSFAPTTPLQQQQEDEDDGDTPWYLTRDKPAKAKQSLPRGPLQKRLSQIRSRKREESTSARVSREDSSMTTSSESHDGNTVKLLSQPTTIERGNFCVCLGELLQGDSIHDKVWIVSRSMKATAFPSTSTMRLLKPIMIPCCIGDSTTSPKMIVLCTTPMVPIIVGGAAAAVQG